MEKYLKTVEDFLKDIGLRAERVKVLKEFEEPENDIINFGSNLILKDGIIYFCDGTHAGDLLHEAGHVATCPSEIRGCLSGWLNEDKEYLDWIEKKPDNFSFIESNRFTYWSDYAASGWAYFVAKHLGLPTFLPFENGFSGDIGNVIWERITSGIENSIGSKESCDLFYSGMLESKGAGELNKFLQD